MIVMGRALYNFGLLLLQKLHSMIVKFKNFKWTRGNRKKLFEEKRKQRKLMF